MAEPAPPLNDDSNPTLVSADGGATQSDDCGSNREGAFVLVLQPPVCASSLDRVRRSTPSLIALTHDCLV